MAALPPTPGSVLSPADERNGGDVGIDRIEPQYRTKRKHGDVEVSQRHSSDSGAANRPMIPKPACLRCRSKKIKCDALVPKCSACAKSGSECRLSATAREERLFDREYLESLYASAKELEAQQEELTRQIREANHTPIIQERNSRPPVQRSRSRDGNTAPNATERSQGVNIATGNESRPKDNDGGLGFLRVILGSIRLKGWDNCLHDPHGASSKPASAHTISRERDNGPVADRASSTQAFSPQMGDELTKIYLRKAFIKHPFMTRSTIQNTTRTVLGSLSNPRAISDQDHFRAFMIFAIGAVYRNQELRYRRLVSDQFGYIDPYDLYATALSRMNGLNTLHGVDAVTNLLLIARFGFFCITGISLWDISFLCLRIAIESGLHKEPQGQLTAIQEQMQRRVFWQCYNLDRHSSTTLGRPFGIPDARITVKLPVNIDDEILELSSESLDIIETMISTHQITEISIFCTLTRLRTICSRMVTDFKRLKRKLERKQQSTTTSTDSIDTPSAVFSSFTLPGQVWQLYDSYLKELLQWRVEFPEGPTTISSHYHDTRWLDLHLLQEKLLLSRHALDLMPLADQSNVTPPGQLIDDFYNAAKDIILLYSELSAEAAIEPAQGRFYRVFIAGLSMLYVVIVQQKKVVSEEKISTRNSNSETPSQWFASRQNLLKECHNTLERMAKALVDKQMALRYLTIYEVLCREVLKHTSQSLRLTDSGQSSRGQSVTDRPRYQHSIDVDVVSREPLEDLSAESQAAATALSHLATATGQFHTFEMDNPTMPQGFSMPSRPPTMPNIAGITHAPQADNIHSMAGLWTQGNPSYMPESPQQPVVVDAGDTFGWFNGSLVDGYSPGIYTGYDQNPGMLLSDWEGIFNVLVNE